MHKVSNELNFYIEINRDLLVRHLSEKSLDIKHKFQMHEFLNYHSAV